MGMPLAQLYELYILNSNMSIIQKSICLFFLISFSLNVDIQSQVILEGNIDKTLSIKSISFYKYTDYITFQDTVLSVARIDSNGHFMTSFPLKQTQMIMVNFGRKLIKFFAEKDKTYHLIFPPYDPITIADSLNPYFKPENYWLGIDDTASTELNRQILRFLTHYNALLTSDFYMILQKGNSIKIDTFYQKIDSLFGQIKNPFLQNYITYKLAYLRFMSNKRDMRYITWHYFTHKPILYQNPAYMALFNGIYKDFFQYYSNQPKGQTIYNDIAEGKSPTLIKKTLQNRYEMQDDTLCEFIMLKGLYDGAYPSKLADFSYFPRKQILMTLDSIATTSAIPEHRQIAAHIVRKIIHDFFDPIDSLKTLIFYDTTNESEQLTFDNFKGKYNYVVFCDINNLPCQENFVLIQQLLEKYRNVLEVTLIFVKSQKEAIDKYFLTNKLTLPYYLVDNINQIKSCNISVIPTFILIDPYGKIIHNPAHSAVEDFEHYFQIILRNRQ